MLLQWGSGQRSKVVGSIWQLCHVKGIKKLVVSLLEAPEALRGFTQDWLAW